MYKTTSFKKKVLTTAIASAVMAAGFSGMAYAQDDSVEEVMVTGIRGSLIRSMDTKRESGGVVDAINAEDMGKFPDSNLAESLQRITGVAISRRNGEGSQVTVRGFGPDYNMITLNGRLMPATSLNQNGGGVSQGRAFDMDNLASESVSAVEVYKTGKADIASGGIGATINIKTLRPFDNPGFKASIGAKAVNDTTTRVGDDLTPEVSGLLSWSDDEERFGASLTASYQDRDSAASGAYVNNWNSALYNGTLSQVPTAPAHGAPVNITNEPGLGDLYTTHSDLRYTHADRERTRSNAQLTLQWRPVETVTTTLDYTMAEQDIFENRSELSAWMDTYKSDLVFDDSVPATPVLYWEERRNQNPRDIGLALQQQNQINKLESTGLNVVWQASDEFSLELDAHDSKSTSLPDAAYGNWINVGLGANVSRGQGVDFTGKFPILMLDFSDAALGNGNGQLDKSEVGSAVGQINNDRAESNFTQVRVDGTYEFENESSISFGVESREMESNFKSSFSQELFEGGWGIAKPGDVPEEFLTPLNYGALFSGYNLSPRGEADTFFSSVSGGTAKPLLQGFIGNAAQVGEHLASQPGSQLDWEVNPTDNLNRTITEEVTAAYVQVDLESSLGDMPVDIIAGLRYEDTDVTSVDLASPPTTVVWQSNNDFQIPAGSASVLYSETASYDHLLPNLDMSVDIQDDLKARFSYSKTIARARYDAMGSAATGLGGPTLPTVISGSIRGGAAAGNPGIKPLESDNFDLSLEWYFDDASYVSAGYFKKNVSNFIGNELVVRSLYDIKDPTNGPRALEAIADLNALGVPVNDTSLFSMVAANILGVGYNTYTAEQYENMVDVLSASDDELMEFRVNQPVNNKDSSLSGWEFAAQHFFGETGFGVQANYTMVDGKGSDGQFDNAGDPTVNQFALTGLSDTANMSLMYENFGIQARISYNWRDEFLTGIQGGNRPLYVEEYSQVDFSVGYEVTDNFTVALEGLNIFEEDSRVHERTNEQLNRLEILGARYTVSARYNF